MTAQNFQPNRPMYFPETPQAPRNTFVLRDAEILAKCFELSLRIEIALDLALQRFENARHRNQNRDALAPYRRNDFRRIERILKMNAAPKQRRDPYAHELPENVARRNEVQKTERVNKSFPLEVGLYARFKRFEVGENVSVRYHDPFWLRSRARGKNDLRNRTPGEGRGSIWFAGVPGDGFPEGIEKNHGTVFINQSIFAIRQHEPGFHAAAPRAQAKSAVAPWSIGTATAPRRMHPKNAATHSAEFRPHSRTRSPGSIPILSNSRAHLSREIRDLAIGRAHGPVSGELHKCRAATVSRVFSKVIDERLARHGRGLAPPREAASHRKSNPIGLLRRGPAANQHGNR